MTTNSGLRVGLLLPTREATLCGAYDPLPLLELASRAEATGFDSVWAGESPVARPRFDPLVLLAAVAARTDLTVGTAVVLPALRNPVAFAHTVASLDRVARGRLILGVGAGFPYQQTETEFDTLGARFDQRVGRLVETVRICRQLWAQEEPSSFEGRYTRFSDVAVSPSPAQTGGPRFWLGGATPKTLQRTGRLFDGWFPYPPSAEQYSEGSGKVSAAAQTAGRDPNAVDRAFYATVTVDDDPRKAQAAVEDYAQRYYGFDYELVSQIMAYYAGTPAGLVEYLQGFVDAGAHHIVLRIGSFDREAQFRRLTEDVLPALREREPTASRASRSSRKAKG